LTHGFLHASQIVGEFTLEAGDLLLELSHLLLFGKFLVLPLDNRVILIVTATVTVIPSVSIQVAGLSRFLLPHGLKLVSRLLVLIRQLLLLLLSESLVLVPASQAHSDQKHNWGSILHPISSLVRVRLLVQSVLDQHKALTRQNQFESV